MSATETKINRKLLFYKGNENDSRQSNKTYFYLRKVCI